MFIGKNILKLKRVDSTNTYLKDALSKSAPLKEGTVIMAVEQFAGRGQTNNTWISEPGKNLIISILLNPVFLPINEQFNLNKTICLAINDVMVGIIGKAAKIKWPNDIYYNSYKLGGILIENLIQGSQIKHAIIGIGINVNQTEFPPNIKNVTSLKQILHTDYDLQILLNEICGAVEKRYAELRASKSTGLNADYLERLFLMNQNGKFLIDGMVVTGQICGVTDEGYLQVDLTGGVRQFGLKEIEFLHSQQ